MKDFPEVIYLQRETEDETYQDFEKGESTWCAEQINDADVQYVRADAVQSWIIQNFKNLSNAVDSIMRDDEFEEQIEANRKRFEEKRKEHEEHAARVRKRIRDAWDA